MQIRVLVASGKGQCSRRAFTLIELLVVISIIAILSAILFPVFARARENSRRTSCMSNLRQIGLGFMQYTQDYDEKFPGTIRGTWGATGTYVIQTDPSMPGARFTVSDGAMSHMYISWMDMIFPYVKNVPVFICPSATAPPVIASYGYNFGIHNGTSPIGLSSVVRPTESILVMDYNVRYGLYANPGEYGLWTADRTSSYHPFVVPHMDGTNFVYCDGHVKWQSMLNAVTTSPANWTNRAWNPTLP